MKLDAITIKDIAKALGLSASTVSRALRDSYEISEETKKRIRAYANENNYRPNLAALSLRKGKSKSIGVIVADIANSYFSQVIGGIESVANEKGYNVIITQSKDSAEREQMIVTDLTSRSIDGLIVSLAAGTTDYSIFEEMTDRGVPLVFIDRIAENIDTHKVTADNFTGGYQAVKHLAGNGYKKIALIANNKNLSISKERIEGCIKAFEELGLEQHPQWVQFCAAGGSDDREIEKVITSLLAMESSPDALLTLSDTLSLKTLRILKQKQMKIPGDIGLMGFSNFNNSELLDPALSVIYQPSVEMGSVAATLLLADIESKRPVTSFTKQVLSTRIITRKSSAPAHS
ncbi:LacI family DNA-binding transcriptional regulator [Niabella beijingensis]|uniref:LacI family DNA-binding transcriptional regulator n=1 Tax=Niabella beijingensis TaxID=2872700 RepID=UPI001CBFB046|nr:LacI family DNA-binding transcriptional regulator [Niabella beijingensis]MBZ4188992.1 LacI family transcriptional regulator [Niabella beijingensis]